MHTLHFEVDWSQAWGDTFPAWGLLTFIPAVWEHFLMKMDQAWRESGMDVGVCAHVPFFLQKTPGIAACYTPATPGGISVNLQTPGVEDSSLSSAIFETTAGFYTLRPLPPRTIKPALTGQGKLLYIRGVF